MQLREEGEVSAASGGPLQEGNVVPAPNPRPLRTHNLIILSRNVGLPLGRVRVTHSTCLAGGWGDVRFLCREPWMTWKRLVGDRDYKLPPGRGTGKAGTEAWLWATEKSASLLSLRVDTKQDPGPIQNQPWLVQVPQDLLSGCLCVYLCCCCLVAQWCPILWDPMDCSLPSCSDHGIFQARRLE